MSVLRVCDETIGKVGRVRSVYVKELILTSLLLSWRVVVLASWWLCLAWEHDCCRKIRVSLEM